MFGSLMFSAKFWSTPFLRTLPLKLTTGFLLTPLHELWGCNNTPNFEQKTEDSIKKENFKKYFLLYCLNSKDCLEYKFSATQLKRHLNPKFVTRTTNYVYIYLSITRHLSSKLFGSSRSAFDICQGGCFPPPFQVAVTSCLNFMHGTRRTIYSFPC